MFLQYSLAFQCVDMSVSRKKVVSLVLIRREYFKKHSFEEFFSFKAIQFIASNTLNI
jgi:hypothetical protein